MILILVLLVVFTTLSIFLWIKGRRIWAGALSLPAVLILLGIGYFIDYYSPRHWIEIKLPINLSDAKYRQVVEFELPKKEYILTTVRRDKSYVKGSTAFLKYALEIPSQNLKIENEREMDFSVVDERRMESFKLEKDNSKGRLSAEVTKAGSGNVYLIVRTNRTLDM